MSTRRSRRQWLLAGALACAFVPGSALAAAGQPVLADPAATAETLPAEIPLFPLRDVVLFPDTTQALYVFEPRYRAMVADALEGDGIIGTVLLQPVFEADYEGRPPVHAIGCAGVITRAVENDDGTYNIELFGLARFAITDEDLADRSRPYRLALVEALPETIDAADRQALGA